jgi:hypothetical protein
MTGGGRPSNAVVVIGADVDLDASGGTIDMLIESFDRTVLFPSVLVDTGIRHELLDEWRLRGHPVMEQRPITRGKRPVGGVRALLELVHWLRASDADVVYVAACDRKRVDRVRRARRLTPRVTEVVEVTLDATSSGRAR